MNQKHLLEMAAKASGKDLTGYQWIDTPFYTGFQRRNIDPESGFEEQTQDWNPLDDNADAFELMVDLTLDVDFIDQWTTVWHWIGDDRTVEVESENCDRYAATRLAIVRAAAAIGEKL